MMKYCPYCRKHVNTYDDGLRTEREIVVIFYCEECNKWIETLTRPRFEDEIE